MIQNDFKRHFETYKLPYKIVMFNHLDFCENLEQFYELFNFFAEPMELNNFRSCDTADYKSFHDMKYLSAQLKDIAENGSLDDERVLVYCQPVRNVNAGNYDTAEALMRLKLKDTGMVYPNRFIPLAEKNGYIHKLSMIILNKTCRAIREFQDEGYQLSRVSVNFSISELSSKNFMEEFRQIPLFYEQFYTYIARENRLFANEIIRTADLTGEQLWMLDEGHCFRDQLERFCQLKAARASQLAYHLGSMETFMRMVEGGKGITFIPELATLQLDDRQKELVRPFAIPCPTRQIILLTNRSFIRNTLLKTITQEITAAVPKEMLSLKATQALV